MQINDASDAPTDRKPAPAAVPRPDAYEPAVARVERLRLQLDDVAFALALVAHEAGTLEPKVARLLRMAIAKLGVVRQSFDPGAVVA